MIGIPFNKTGKAAQGDLELLSIWDSGRPEGAPGGDEWESVSAGELAELGGISVSLKWWGEELIPSSFGQ